MSTINRILSRGNVSMACFLVGTSAFTYLYGRESLFSKQYVNYIQKYNDKEPVHVQTVLKYRLQTVLNDMEISEYDRDFYYQFITKELDPVTCGAVSVRQGVRIGIPEYYQAANPRQVKLYANTIHGTEIPWTSEDGEKLLQLLLLPENVQKFALVKAILMSQNYYHFFNAAFPPFFCWGYLALTDFILSYRKLHLRSGLFTLSVYILSGILLGAMYIFADNALYLQYDKITFEDAMKISHSYIMAAIEHSDKVVERNKILRRIVKNGDKYYDEDGDERALIRPIGIPASVKAELARDHLKQFEFEKEAYKPAPVNPNPLPEF